MKTLLAAILATLLPLAAVAQAGPGPDAAHGPRGAWGPGQGGGPGGPGGPGMHDPKRAKLALTLGLAEALDLDEAQALKLRTVVDQFHQKREPLQQQQRDAMKVLRAAAMGEKAEAPAVDQALVKLLDARAQLQVLDRDLVQGITKDLPPQKKARAVMFLGRFHRHMAEQAGRMGRQGGMRHPGMERGAMDHGGMDHGGMDHGGMDHGGMNHGGPPMGALDRGAPGAGGDEFLPASGDEPDDLDAGEL